MHYVFVGKKKLSGNSIKNKWWLKKYNNRNNY